MKRLLLLFFALFISISGCSLFASDDAPNIEDRIIDDDNSPLSNDTTIIDEKKEPEIITVEGYIVEHDDKALFEKGSHILQDEDETLLYVIDSEFEDLSDYIDEGKVKVKGERKELEDSEEPYLEIHTISYLETPKSEKETPYSNTIKGISLTLPPRWLATENGTETELYASKKENSPTVIIQRVPLDSDVGSAFQDERDSGTEISVDGKRSFRFLRNSSETDIYVLLGSEVLYISFAGNEEEKAAFYDIILSVKIEDDEYEPTPCGGDSGFVCDEGYRCELESDEDDSIGICVEIKSTEEDTEEIEEEELEEEIEETDTETPEDDESNEEEEEEEDPEVESRIIREEEDPDVEGLPEEDAPEDEKLVMETVRSEINTLAPDEASDDGSWEVELFTFSDGNLVSVEYKNTTNEEERRKILLQYTIENDAVDFEQEAYFLPGEEADWTLEDGQNLQSNKATEIFNDDGEKKAEVAEGYSLYESTHYKFQVEFPKNFYYSHLGSIDDSISTVVFSNAPADNENALIRLEILDGEEGKAIESEGVLILPRDENSHFRITAESDDVIENVNHMAESIISSL